MMTWLHQGHPPAYSWNVCVIFVPQKEMKALWCSNGRSTLRGALWAPAAPHVSRFYVVAAAAPAPAANLGTDHGKFITEVAGSEPPMHLQALLNVLQAKGEQIVAPDYRKGLLPLSIPLSEDPSSGTVTALLRWPTAPEGMEMPVVQVQKYGVSLLAKSVTQYVHRILAEEDIRGDEACYNASGDSGKTLYKKGDFENSKVPSLDFYLLKKVGLFPDVFERLALNHLEKGDEMSALVTGEFYVSKKHFPGFGRPLVFNAELMITVGRKTEAKDAARIALKSPWWTLGCEYEKVAEMAGWGDEKVEYMREKMTEEGKQEELQKGKAPAQVALDQAAFLLDLAGVDGNWDGIREQLASFYKEAGLDTMSRFVLL